MIHCTKLCPYFDSSLDLWTGSVASVVGSVVVVVVELESAGSGSSIVASGEIPICPFGAVASELTRSSVFSTFSSTFSDSVIKGSSVFISLLLIASGVSAFCSEDLLASS
ncbi:hypothetical protein WICPIJ_003338 [Wickerhamomyces pijperi]|uniref:Uncharacterized protein n=1 Tax=Wickerhamomyces pijperi TaxID=599730 RepID=A0A9P8Q7C1_WICPI|nr:hypothetical protein WICPIJ_003338 [Wickerhamomyces pijperi]